MVPLVGIDQQLRRRGIGTEQQQRGFPVPADARHRLCLGRWLQAEPVQVTDERVVRETNVHCLGHLHLDFIVPDAVVHLVHGHAPDGHRTVEDHFKTLRGRSAQQVKRIPAKIEVVRVVVVVGNGHVDVDEGLLSLTDVVRVRADVGEGSRLREAGVLGLTNEPGQRVKRDHHKTDNRPVFNHLPQK